jgi:hypothetical protein
LVFSAANHGLDALLPLKRRGAVNSVDKQKRLHFDVTNVGLRAQATAVGLVQLCIELHNANILSDLALQRIKDAIADEVSIAAPRRTAIQNFRREIRERLDRLFGGQQPVGSAEALAFGSSPQSEERHEG